MNDDLLHEVNSMLDAQGLKFVLIIQDGPRTGICHSNMKPVDAVQFAAGVINTLTEAWSVSTDN